MHASSHSRLFVSSFSSRSYTQEIPSRFKKDICRAAVNHHEDSSIAVEGLQRVLANIGLSHRLSDQEIKVIFQEIGNESGVISAQKMVQIL
jgi:hypothetical protein